MEWVIFHVFVTCFFLFFFVFVLNEPFTPSFEISCTVFENIMANEVINFADLEHLCSIFHNIFKSIQNFT